MYHRFAWSPNIAPLMNLRLQRPVEIARCEFMPFAGDLEDSSSWGPISMWTRALTGTHSSSDHPFVWPVGLTDSQCGWRTTLRTRQGRVACASPQLTDDVNNRMEAFDHECQRIDLRLVAILGPPQYSALKLRSLV